MKRFLGAVAGTFLVVVANGGLGAETHASPCSLLTSDEIAKATGGAAGAPNPNEMEMPVSATKNATVYTCMWAVAAQKGLLTLSLGPLPPGMTVETLTRQNVGVNNLKAAHYTEEGKTFGNVACSIMSPPPSQKQGLFMSQCSAGVKGEIISLVFISPTKKLTINQTKSLLDKAVARLR